MDRRTLFTAITAGAALTVGANAQAAEGDALMDVLNTSAKEKKGVTLYVQGAQVALVVTRAGQDYVEGRSREHSRIVIRTDKIDGAALS